MNWLGIYLCFLFLLDTPRLNPLILKRTITLSKIQDGHQHTSCCVALWENFFLNYPADFLAIFAASTSTDM